MGRTVALIFFILLLYLNFLTSFASALVRYSPTVMLDNPDELASKPHYSNEDVVISAKVNDKYGEINDTLLFYSTNGTDWKSSKMYLMDGNKSSGVFAGTIPRQRGNISVFYKLFLKDTLGYSYASPEILHYKVTNKNDTTPPQINFSDLSDPTRPPLSHEPTEISIYTEDNGGAGIRNVTVKYVNASNMQNYSASVQEDSENDYRAIIPPLPPQQVNKLRYYVIVYDNVGNKNETRNSFDYKNGTEKDNPSDFKITAKITSFELSNLTSKIQISGVGDDINNTSEDKYAPSFAFINTDYYKSKFIGQDKITNIHYNKEPSNHHNIDYFNARLPQYNASLSLLGDPSSFPFDRYYLNLVFAVPFANTIIHFDNINFEPTIERSWSTSNISSQINKTSDAVLKKLCDEKNDMTGMKVYCNQLKMQFGNIKISFDRNYTISSIIVPLIAVFFLLGATFILDSKSEGGLAIRISITIGVFAFLFTFTPIINEMKPPTLNTPTIADFLVSTIIMATIAFTISSVITSSSAIKDKFPSGVLWIDRITFFIVLMITVTTAAVNNYPLDITYWLLPLILFGLSYGLLFQIAWNEIPYRYFGAGLRKSM
jgi:hypothetical protein